MMRTSFKSDVKLSALPSAHLLESERCSTLQARQQPEAGAPQQTAPKGRTPSSARAPGLPRVPLSQANLNASQPALYTSPAPSAASTTTGLHSRSQQLPACCYIFSGSTSAAKSHKQLMAQALVY